MNKRRLIISCVLVTMLVSGCNVVIREKADKQQVSQNNVSNNNVSVSNNVVSANDIILCTPGYEKMAPKKAIILGNGEVTSYQVFDSDTDTIVYEGIPEIQGDETSDIKYCDFSLLEKPGKYYIYTDNEDKSEDFTVEDGLYKNILDDRIDYYNKNNEYDYNKDSVSKAYIRIADFLIANSLFGEDLYGDTDKEDKEIPQLIKLAAKEIDALSECIEEDGRLSISIRGDLGSQYQYAAVFAMFADEYAKYDNMYTTLCSGIANKAMDYAEKAYIELSDKEQQEIDDKRYWALAQMYKHTGETVYSHEIEKYADCVPSGFNEEDCGYFGTFAYLTCNRKIDMKLSRILMDSFMNDAIQLSEDSLKSDNYVVAADEKDIVQSVFSNARLFVLANYVSKNIRYIKGAENQLEYLYGRNPYNEDYAFGIDSEYYDEPQALIISGLVGSYIYDDKR